MKETQPLVKGEHGLIISDKGRLVLVGHSSRDSNTGTNSSVRSLNVRLPSGASADDLNTA